MQCVMLCAGKATLESSDIPKALLPIGDTTILDYNLNLWGKALRNDLIVVVGYKSEAVMAELPSGVTTVLQMEQKGIAHAIAQVELLVKDRFIVLLGDCIMKGEFHELPFKKRGNLGLGVWFSGHNDEVHKNYGVEIIGDLVKYVVEKPKMKNGLCGMGLYSFDKRVFYYIQKTNPSPLRNEVEITDVIQNMIEEGEEVFPAYFQGGYVNVTTKEDLPKAEMIISSRVRY